MFFILGIVIGFVLGNPTARSKVWAWAGTTVLAGLIALQEATGFDLSILIGLVGG